VIIVRGPNYKDSRHRLFNFEKSKEDKMISLIAIFLFTIASTQTDLYIKDEDGVLYIEETNIVPQYDFFYDSRDSFPQMPGWPQHVGVSGTSRPTGVTLADVNEDGYLEILVGSSDSSFHIWDYRGNELPGWPKTGLDLIHSKPAVGDVDPSYPGLEIFIAGRTDTLYAWHYDGTELSGWPQIVGETSVLKSPVIFDIDGDSDLEIILGQRDYPNGRVLVFNHDGSMYPGWPQSLYLMCVATPSVGDVDEDGIIEICALDYRGVYLWDKDGNLEEGWPKLNDDWGSSYAQPVLADLDDDGDLEILQAYSIYSNHQNYVGIYHHDGTNFANWPQQFPGPQTYSTPVCADIDNDGDLEIFGGGHISMGKNLLARHHTGDSVIGWPVLVDMLDCSPIVFDFEPYNGVKREIFVGDNQGHFYAYYDDGTILPGWPIYTGCSFTNSPSVGDVDADGDIEIAFVVSNGTVNLWTFDGVTYRSYLTEWGTWFHDNWNTGWFHPKAPQNLNATSSPSWVYLTWDANTEPDIAGYNIYRSETTGGPYTKINDTPITETSYYDVPPLDTTLCYYCITAQIKAFTESRLSNEASGSVGILEGGSEQTVSISIFPNPFTNAIKFNIPGKRTLWVKIYDSRGRLIDEVAGDGTIEWLPGKSISNGIYFAKFRIANRTGIKKIIKIK